MKRRTFLKGVAAAGAAAVVPAGAVGTALTACQPHRTPEAFVDAIAAWERQAHGYAPE